MALLSPNHPSHPPSQDIVGEVRTLLRRKLVSLQRTSSCIWTNLLGTCASLAHHTRLLGAGPTCLHERQDLPQPTTPCSNKACFIISCLEHCLDCVIHGVCTNPCHCKLFIWSAASGHGACGRPCFHVGACIPRSMSLVASSKSTGPFGRGECETCWRGMAEPVDHHRPFLLVSATHKRWLDEASVAWLDLQETIFSKTSVTNPRHFAFTNLNRFFPALHAFNPIRATIMWYYNVRKLIRSSHRQEINISSLSALCVINSPHQ